MKSAVTLIGFLWLSFSVWGQIPASAKIKGDYYTLKSEYQDYVLLKNFEFEASKHELYYFRQEPDVQNWTVYKGKHEIGKVKQEKNSTDGLYWQFIFQNDTLEAKAGYANVDNWDDNREVYLTDKSDTLWIYCLEPDCNSHYELTDGMRDYDSETEPAVLFEAKAKAPCEKTMWAVKQTKKHKLSENFYLSFVFMSVASPTICNDERYAYDLRKEE